jgi:hypothetical protein
MQSPARQRDLCPIPPHSSVHLKPSTVGSLLTPLFAASPSISSLSPLSTAFTHFDRGVWVAFQFPLDSQLSLAKPRVASRVCLFSASYKTLCSRNAVRSIFNPFPFRDLQIPLSATRLFCHLYKTPGCHPFHFPLGNRLAASALSFPLLCQVQPLARSP